MFLFNETIGSCANKEKQELWVKENQLYMHDLWHWMETIVELNSFVSIWSHAY